MILLIFASAFYAAFVWLAALGLRRLPHSAANSTQPMVSIVIAARNEEKNIQACMESLLAQQYPNYEILVVDDQSTDATAKIVQDFTLRFPQVKYFRQADAGAVSPKKAALSLGIAHAHGEFIFTTDADCLAGPLWLQTMMAYFTDDVAAVAGWLQIAPGATLLNKIEAVDSFSLSLVGAAGFGWYKPFMANGANFAYRKSVFDALGGFSGNLHYASGDDDLLLQKISALPNWRCAFCTDVRAVILTAPQENLSAIFHQRFRWASKAGIYPNALLLLEVFLYLYILCTAFFPVLIFISPLFLLPALVKFCTDFSFITIFLHKWGRPQKFYILLLAEYLQMLYILLAGVWGVIGSYHWKDRRYERGQIHKK